MVPVFVKILGLVAVIGVGLYSSISFAQQIRGKGGQIALRHYFAQPAQVTFSTVASESCGDRLSFSWKQDLEPDAANILLTSGKVPGSVSGVDLFTTATFNGKKIDTHPLEDAIAEFAKDKYKSIRIVGATLHCSHIYPSEKEWGVILVVAANKKYKGGPPDSLLRLDTRFREHHFSRFDGVI